MVTLLLLLLMLMSPAMAALPGTAGNRLETQSTNKCLVDTPTPAPRYMQWREEEVTIRVQASDRPGSRLLSHIYSTFLKEVLGYRRVELVTQQDHFNMTGYIQTLSECPTCDEEQFGPDQNSTKDQPPASYVPDEPLQPPRATVNLDAWAPPGYELDHYTADTHNVLYAGSLGPMIRMGWFFHAPAESRRWPFLDHWRAFQRLDSARVFNLTEEELLTLRPHLRDTLGRFHCGEGCVDGVFLPLWCQNSPCAVLLASRPDGYQFVLEQIVQMRLRVRVFWIGEHLSDVVRRMSAAGRPVLFVQYTPSLLTLQAKYDEVLFPACVKGTFCSTGSRYLKKFAWNKLKDGAIVAYKALRLMHLTQWHYEDLLRSQLEQPLLSYPEVACRWLRNHSHVWASWKPADRLKIAIGGIFPIGGTNYNAKGVIPAAVMAIQAVNNNNSILRDYELTLTALDGQCSADMVMKSFIDYLRMPTHKHMAGILGPACSDTVEPIAGVSRHYRVVVISYSAEGVLFSNRSQYPYFFRTIGENKKFRFVYKQLLHQLKWKRVASLTEVGQKYSEYISILHDMLQESGVTFISNRKFPRDTRNMETYLLDLKEKNARIIIADSYEMSARAVMCGAYHRNMTARQGYVWFLPEWFASDWYNHTSDMHLGCKPEQIMEAMDGHLALSHAYFANDSDIMQENITVHQWRHNYTERCDTYPVAPSDYAGYAYDAVWTYAFALDQLLREKPSRLEDFHTEQTNARFVEILKATNFNGVSGNIQFVGPSRVTIIHVKQWRRGQYHVVGRFEPDITSPDGGRLILDERKIEWLTADGRRPQDGTLAPCDLQPLADLLGTTCQNVMVVVNIIGLFLLLCILLSCVLFYKRRYDKKMLRLRELGLESEAELRLDEWEVKRENVVLNRRLGEGAFGTVYGGEALIKDKPVKISDRKWSVDHKEEWRSVAVKTLKVNSSIEEKLDFLTEAEVMKEFNHTNIVQLLGVCTRSEPILTVMEFMLYGDLKTFLLSRRSLVSDKLFKDENNEISNKKLTSMARDVACALSYLAEKKYVHRDVACRNCLINAQHVVKLADFGMTRYMCENDYYRFNRKGMLPVRWMAPESLTDGLFTPKADVWSYGVLLFEIITFGSFPFQGLSNNQVLEFVRAGHHVGVPHGVKAELAELLLSCWLVKPDRRPDARDIVELLGIQFPRLISPCLDVPLSVVPIEGSEGHPNIEVDLNTNRKHSLSLAQQRVPQTRLQRSTSHEMSDIPEAERLVNGAAGTQKYSLLDKSTETTDV